MKRLLTHPEDLAGKTIAFAEGSRTELLLSFTDDTCAYIEIDIGCGNAWFDFAYSLPENYARYMCEQLHRMKIIDAEEFARLKAAQEAADLQEAKANAASKRRQYEELKREFEGESS